MIYLDNSATTTVLPEVQKEMVKYLSMEFGNPSSKYYNLAENAKSAIDKSRSSVANLLSAKDSEIIFTSGATESNNMIIKGVADYYQSHGKHIITSKAEHRSVLEVCYYLEERGFEVTYLDVDSFGRIRVEDLKKSIRNDTILVSIIWGNNELGSLNSMDSIATICKKYGVFLHTDATQVIGKMEVNLLDYEGITFLSFSAHKMHGPKGVGVAYIRSDKYNMLTPITPLLHGGEQEPYRSGTYPVHNIVGLGEASRIAMENIGKNYKQLVRLEQKLIDILNKKFENSIALNSDIHNKVPGIVNLRFKGINNQILLKKISPIIAASTGSACSTTSPSYVLKSIGLEKEAIQESIRFSLSPYTDIEELEVFKRL